MKTQVKIATVLVAALLACLLLGAQAFAVTPKPAWSLQSLAGPTNFEPGEESGKDLYEVFITNSGGALTDGTPITITDTLPAGLEVKDVALEILDGTNRKDVAEDACAPPQSTGDITTLTCTVDESLSGLTEAARVQPLEQLRLVIRLSVPPEAAGVLTNQVELSGGGAEDVTVNSQNQASPEPADSGFQEFHTTLTDAAGQPASGADSHPYAYTTSFALNTEPTPPGSSFPFRPAQGDLRNIEVPLPPGLIANPTATQRCTIAQFNAIEAATEHGLSGISRNQCPDSSAAGVILIEQLDGAGGLGYYPIYNLEPPRGMPAQLGFQVLGLPFYINARLRSDSDYGVTGYLQNVSEAKRVTASVVSLWGVPWAPVHDRLRGNCAKVLGIVNCPAGAGDPRPLWRLPSSCAAELPFSMSFDTWLDPGEFKSASLTDPAPTDCELPPFEPTVEARPTTNVADAPSGLHFNLHLPQAANEDPDGLAHADLRDATVLLPEGFVVNPSSADGLEACSEAEVGYRGVLEGRHAFSADPARCPDGSKIGNVSVSTPLVDHPLPGAVYLATPHRNPFDSLIAIYIAIDDPQSGVVVKLAGKVSADPASGRLQTTVEQNPQTPFEDFTFDFFEGARAPLRTPATCGVHTTRTTLTPWTAPASPALTPTDSFAITQSPGGGDCPGDAQALPNSPGFEAGTITPLAGAYSPFALRLSRADGSQELNGLDLTLPPGLSGKLAGLGQCPEQALAAAASHSGAAEQASPSCPASSQLGSVSVAAGAGPAPYHAQGTVYLAGPYKGAPISMAVITPALAGPFDLGTVVVRAPLYIDPESARIRAVSDPLPTILEGIPLDVRSVVLRVSRDQFTLNPTSCDPLAFSGLALSALGQAAPLTQRFQVGGCEELSFKPKLALRLKGPVKRTKNPRLIATYTAGPGEAAARRLQVKLPASAFLDNDHIATICTRVQFAADACPAGSVYGKATATTPLLAEPLSGPVILRSSSNPLPDLVVDLHGPPALPIRVALVGRTDSVKGALRNTFEGLPDVPAGRVRIELFGGNRGLIEMSGGFCRRPRAAFRARAQSGAVLRSSPKVAATCSKGKRKAKRRGHRGAVGTK